ncbi:hypothetical protein FQZ97_1158910 [compost metagenome]
MYLVAAWMEMSTPCLKEGKCTGVPQVLSSITSAPWAWATAAMAGTSCTSKVREPGDSRNTTRVLGRISAAMPSPICGS